MSNQEPQNQEKTTEEPALEKRRRFIKGAGIAAPVVLSLANRSAFGAQCLSQQISGNMSHMVRVTVYWVTNRAVVERSTDVGTICSKYYC